MHTEEALRRLLQDLSCQAGMCFSVQPLMGMCPHGYSIEEYQHRHWRLDLP